MNGTPDLRALVERLENCANRPRDIYASTDLCRLSAAALTTLQHQLAEMEAALEPFAREADRWTSQTPDAAPMRTEVIREAGWDYSFTLGDLRKARSTLKGERRP